VRNRREQIAPTLLGDRMLVLDAPQLVLHARDRLELLGRRLPLQLRLRAQIGDARLELAPACVHLEQLVERLHRPLSRERDAKALGILPRCADVDHPAKNASIVCATPSSSAGGETKSARAFNAACAFSTATP